MSTKELQVFNFEEQPIRTVEQNGELFWVAGDVCKALSLGNITWALERVGEDDFSQTKVVDSLGREQATYIVNESGLYSLILGSDKPEAKRFKKWVTSEVLPAIRKTGRYSKTQSNEYGVTVSTLSPEYYAAIELAKAVGFTGNQALISANRVIKAKYGEDCLLLLGNPTLVCDVQDAEMNATSIGLQLGLSPNKVNLLSEKLGLISTTRDAKKRVVHFPTEKGKGFCFLKDVNIEGSSTSKQQLMYYQSAVEYLKANK